MTRARAILRVANDDERGHAAPLVPALAGAVGAIVLAIGAASDSDVVACIGGIVLALGLLATVVVSHMAIDYGIYSRLENLEK